MTAVAEDEPFSVEALDAFRRAHHAWVAVDAGDEPIGYVLVELVDGNAHLEQLSVHPAHRRRGAGRALVEHVASWAARSGLPAVTLTAFAEVPWNGPYYERLGFRTLHGADVTVGLRAKRSVEAARGLDAWPRVCMRRDLSADLLSPSRQP
jgi:GNAT superfamily N-acetyltransferase